MPCAIDYQTVVAATQRDDNIVRVLSVDYDNAVDEFDITSDITFQSDKMWANYIRGVVKCLLARGYNFKGADIAVSGNVPQGAGLSSSAALEVVIGQTFKVLYNLNISQAEIALNGQQAENQFVGCNCGIMDQMISAKGEENHAMLLDCRSLETQAVSMPAEMTVVIINSNKKRGLVDSEYNTRRQQCEAAARIFGVKALRDVTIEQFNEKVSELDEVVAKRARHVITENARTLEAAEALRAHDMKRIGELMAKSHASMRDDSLNRLERSDQECHDKQRVLDTKENQDHAYVQLTVLGYPSMCSVHSDGPVARLARGRCKGVFHRLQEKWH